MQLIIVLTNIHIGSIHTDLEQGAFQFYITPTGWNNSIADGNNICFMHSVATTGY